MQKQNIKKLLLGLFLSLILITPAKAADEQKTITLSIEDCIEIALKNNLDLKIESFTPRIKQLDLQKIYDEFGLSLGFSPNIQNNIRPTSSSFISGGAVLNEFSQNYNFSAKKKFATDGQLSLEFQNSILNTNSTRVDFNPSITPRLALNFQQPVLKNAFNSYRRISIGKNDTSASNLRLKAKAMDIVSLTEQNYWNLALNNERLKVLPTSLNLA